MTEVRVLTDAAPRIVVQPEAHHLEPIAAHTVDTLGAVDPPAPMPLLADRPLPVEELFLTYLEEADKRGVRVSAHKQSPNYAPKVLAKGQPVRASTLEHAMRRLINSGRLIEVKYGRAARPFKRLVAAERAHLAEDAFE